MPSKGGVFTRESGFLRPTFSSASKATEKSTNVSRSKRKSHVAENGQEKDDKTSETNFRNHTGTKLSMLLVDLRTRNTDLYDKVPIPTRVSTSSQNNTDIAELADDNGAATKAFLEENNKTKFETLTENIDVQMKEAQTICNELRREIDDLKLRQQLLLRGSDEENDDSASRNSKLRQGKVGLDATTLDVDIVSTFKPAFRSAFESPVSNSTERSENTPNPSADSSAAHDAVTSSGIDALLARRECTSFSPERLIKKLCSERERYKMKAKLLRRALRKAEGLAMITFPRAHEIAAHDVSYSNVDLIGEGFMSYVYSGRIFKKRKAAIKKLVRPGAMSAADRSYLAAEAGCLGNLRHPNVVRVYGVSTSPLQPLIISELVKGGSLHERLYSRDAQALNPRQYCSILRDVSNGMKYLHGRTPPILHLNLKPCNVLFRTNGRAKVADFGFSKIRLEAGIGNHRALSYFAPELMECPTHLTKKLDVFSFAVILWEMASMQQPYEDMTAWEIFEFVTGGGRLDIPPHLPFVFQDLISKCWDESPMQRPSFKELARSIETVEVPQDWSEVVKHSANGSRLSDHVGSNKSYSTASSARAFKAQHGPFMKRRDYMGDIRDEAKRKLSDELALESDMISMGYSVPKFDYYRSSSHSSGVRTREHSDPLSSAGHISVWSKRRSSVKHEPPSAGKSWREQKDDVQPIARKDLRYVDQDLTVETPKIISGWNRGDARRPEPKWSAAYTSSLRDGESLNDVRTAFSVPNLKHKKSGKEKAPSASVLSTQFSSEDTRYHDVPATHSESKAYFVKDFSDCGWHDSAGAQKRKMLVPSLGEIEASCDGTSPVYNSREKHADLTDSVCATESREPSDRRSNLFAKVENKHEHDGESFGDSQIRVASVPSDFQQSERGDLSHTGQHSGLSWPVFTDHIPVPPARVSKKRDLSIGVDRSGTEAGWQSRDEDSGNTTGSVHEESSRSASSCRELHESPNETSAILRETAQELNAVTAILEAAAEEAEN